MCCQSDRGEENDVHVPFNSNICNLISDNPLSNVSWNNERKGQPKMAAGYWQEWLEKQRQLMGGRCVDQEVEGTLKWTKLENQEG